MAQQPDSDRLIYIDNLRYLMVLMVVVVHGACAYANIFPWWCVTEVNEYRGFFNNLMLILMVFLMPVLFFFAGYFGASSLQKKGAAKFLKSKFLRLGLPLIIVVPIVSPTYSYIYHYTHNGFINKTGFLAYWLQYMKGAANLQMGLIIPIDYFHHSHLWFISLLLFFFILLALFASNIRHTDESTGSSQSVCLTPISLAIPFTLVVIGAVISYFGAILHFSDPFDPAPWVTVGNLLHFQPTSVVSYLLYFGLGVYGFYRNWLIKKKFPGHPTVWATICVIGSMIVITVFYQMTIHPSTSLILLYLTIHSLLCALFLITFIQLARRYWNNTSPLGRRMAANSYTIYLIHFLIVIFLQLFLVQWTGGPVLLKFFIVTSGSIIVSYLISQYCIRPFPRLSVYVIYLVFLFFLLTIQPTTP